MTQGTQPDLAGLFEQLGSDPDSRAPVLIDRTIQATYALGKQDFVVSHRGSYRVLLNAVPSIGVGTQSTVMIVPKVGMWLRRHQQLVGNVNFGIVAGIPSDLPTVDVAAVSQLWVPEGSAFQNPAGGTVQTVLNSTWGTAALPDLFTKIQVGQAGVILIASLFWASVAGSSNFLQDLWCGPNTALCWQAVTANAQMSLTLDFEVPIPTKLAGGP